MYLKMIFILLVNELGFFCTSNLCPQWQLAKFGQGDNTLNVQLLHFICLLISEIVVIQQAFSRLPDMS
jgi:hypothetical protein